MSSVLGLNIATLREWYPPVTRENWRFLLTIFQWTYPIVSSLQSLNRQPIVYITLPM